MTLADDVLGGDAWYATGSAQAEDLRLRYAAATRQATGCARRGPGNEGSRLAHFLHSNNGRPRVESWNWLCSPVRNGDREKKRSKFAMRNQEGDRDA